MADYYSVIARAVSALPSKTDEARHAIYERARIAVQKSLRTHDEPLSPDELATEQVVLEAAISRVEADLHAVQGKSTLSAGLKLYLKDKEVRTLGPGKA